MGCGPIYCLAAFRGLAGLCFWVHKIKVETTHEKNLLQLLFLPSSPGRTAQIIYILNLDIEERTFGVLEIKTQIVFHNHLFLVLTMLSLFSYSVFFLLLLFPLLIILAFLLLFLLLSLLFCMYSFLFSPLPSHSYPFPCYCPTVAKVPYVSLYPSLSSPHTSNQ